MSNGESTPPGSKRAHATKPDPPAPPDADELSARRWHRRLHVAFGVAVASLVVGLVAMLLLTSQINERVQDVVWRADRSTILVGRIGRDLARLRGTALEALTEKRPDEGTVELLQLLERAIEQELAELEPLLGSEAGDAPPHMRAEIAGLRGTLHEALEALESGRPTEAEEALDDAADRAETIQITLAELARGNEEESERMLAHADALLGRLRLYLGVQGAGLAAVLAFSWVASVRRNQVHRERVASAFARLEAANQDLDAFAGRVGHDVKNLLVPLLDLGPLLARATPESADAVAQEVRALGERGIALVDGLLAFSRAGSIPGGEASASVAESVERALGGRRPPGGAQVETRVEDVRVACDPDLLVLVLTNLIDNALKFSEGRPSPRVVVTAEATSPWAAIRIEDNGPGIPPEEQAAVFEPFRRGQSAKAPGSGLGLATVRRVVEAYGGTVSLRSTPGEGACFEVHLPLWTAAEEQTDLPHRRPVATVQRFSG